MSMGCDICRLLGMTSATAGLEVYSSKVKRSGPPDAVLYFSGGNIIRIEGAGIDELKSLMIAPLTCFLITPLMVSDLPGAATNIPGVSFIQDQVKPKAQPLKRLSQRMAKPRSEASGVETTHVPQGSATTKSECVTIPLNPLQDKCSIGRSKECHWVISDSSVSRRHAEIIKIDGKLFLVDADSANGIFHGGKRVRKIELTHEIEVVVGSVPVRFVLPDGSFFPSLVGSTARAEVK